MSDWLSDFVTTVHTTLARRFTQYPSESVLRTLFETIYFASLRTEEAHPITFHVVYLNPENPDPFPPKRVVQDRWKWVALEKRLPFDVSSITKIAKASDPRSSSFAVYHNTNEDLFIWGLIDQGNSYYDFVNYNADEGPERPGLFQASIVSVGHVVVYCGYELIADLRVNELRKSAIDALEHGPVHEALSRCPVFFK